MVKFHARLVGAETHAMYIQWIKFGHVLTKLSDLKIEGYSLFTEVAVFRNYQVNQVNVENRHGSCILTIVRYIHFQVRIDFLTTYS